ncbi:MAG: zinc ribbon domain-containing protein [Massilioclostridium sp.]|nr:zinc ribbon domain-containing protein [Massilioclostridium sp.]
MALITCPECGKEISDQANSCPNCGYPTASNQMKNASELSEIKEDEVDSSIDNVTNDITEKSLNEIKFKSSKKIIVISAIVSMAIIAIIATIFVIQSRDKYVFRHVNWGMSAEKVISSEEKLNKHNDGIYYIDSYIIDHSTNFGLMGNLMYYFDDKNQLVSIVCMYDNTEKNKNLLLYELQNRYGEPEANLGEEESYSWYTAKSRIFLSIPNIKSSGGKDKIGVVINKKDYYKL